MSALTKTFILLHVVMSMLLAAGLIVFVNRVDASAQATKADKAQIARLNEDVRVAQTEASVAVSAQRAVQQQATNQVEQIRAELARATSDALALRTQLAEAQAQAASDKASLTSAN